MKSKAHLTGLPWRSERDDYQRGKRYIYVNGWNSGNRRSPNLEAFGGARVEDCCLSERYMYWGWDVSKQGCDNQAYELIDCFHPLDGCLPYTLNINDIESAESGTGPNSFRHFEMSIRVSFPIR